MRKLIGFVILLGLVAGVVYVAAGFLAGPAIVVLAPERFVGISTPLDVAVEAPGGQVSAITIALEQNGASAEIFALDGASKDANAGQEVRRDEQNRLRVSATVGRAEIPGLASGPARIAVTASRPVLFGLRTVDASVAHAVTVRLEPPRLSILSSHHYVNVGGSELVVYRVQPEDVMSGVAVGDDEYPGYPASGAAIDGRPLSDPSVRLAFFGLEFDHDPKTPIRLFARDEAGNAATATFEYRVYPKPAHQSRIALDDGFLERVVPAILAGTDEVSASGSIIDQFLVVNGELRRKNAETIASFAAKTAPEMLWRGVVFHPFTNSAVESSFADRRTYIYQSREVDRQVHLGFDLASLANAPVLASNRGRVLLAENLGIYGNAVVIDHGMGVQSLYAHLSGIDVEPGQIVEKEQPIGRTGVTGLAGGDHLHFTMLVNGHMVNPIEWWDSHWIEDRILRKLRAVQ
jgi:murein DD-endopeptidase MepM/ murein hydrolase activator NlpD